MKRGLVTSRRLQCSVFSLLLAVASLGVWAGPKRVLILDPFGRDVAPFAAVAAAFRSTLARDLAEPVDIYDIPLDLARFAESDGEAPMVAFLEGRLKSHPVDLVVPIGVAGLRFAVRHRESLFQDTPILAVAPEPRFVPAGFPGNNATLVTYKVNLPAMVEDILQIQPDTKNIFVLFGASAHEKAWANECQREFQPFNNRVTVTFLNEPTLDQTLKRCSDLPPNSFIMHMLFIVDAAGVPCERNEALRRLHEVANAPIFGYYASEFGLGSIGGRLYPDSEIGARGARMAIRILRGEKAGTIAPQILEPTTPVFDWRELERWGISEARLPTGSIIQFRQPGFWQLYRWPIAGTVAFCLLQAALITGLLVNRSQRRQREAEATLISDISSRFVNLPGAEVDREMMDAERRICELLDLDISVVWQWSSGPPGCFTLTHYYSVKDGPQASVQLSDADFPWFRKIMLEKRIVPISSLKDMPAEAALDRENCQRLGIKSNLCLPLTLGGEPPMGILSLNTIRTERRWPSALVKRLQVVAQIFTNALARKRADQALRESEERITLAAEAAEFGVWVWNVAQDRVWGSDRWLELFGYQGHEEINFDKVIKRIHPRDRKGVEQDVERALANRNDYAGEFRTVLPDGTERWITSRGRVYNGAKGTPVRMLGTCVDITARKTAEDSLRASEELSRATFEQAAVGIAHVSTGGRWVKVNDRLCSIFGHSRDELLNLTFEDLIHPEDLGVELDHVRQLLSGQIQNYTVESRYFRKDGSTIWVVHTVSLVRSAAGASMHLISIVEDITQRKRAEAALRDLSGRLIRAHEEERARLARELHDDLTQRLARLAIDAGRVERGADGESSAETMRTVREGLVTLSDDVHALSYRLHPSVLEDLGLGEALKAECERFSRQGPFAIQVDLGELPTSIPPDRALCLFRVAQEAMQNAVRHAQARKIDVSVRALDGGLQLAVQDDGIGFDPALKRDHRSLGLASMRERVYLLEGELHIDSVPGQGTTVLVCLPLEGVPR